ncbi:MAG: UDP-N-acetylmuramate dehydrogenase [Gemmataceae bacterium]
MSLATLFPDITREREPLAPYTHLRIGGPVQYFIQPRTVAELAQLLRYCTTEKIPLRMLGGGFNLLVQDDPVPGAVVRLTGPAFNSIETHETVIRAGGGAALYDLIAAAVAQGLGGLETLVGIRGTVGGSVRVNVGDRAGEIATSVRRVAVLSENGTEQIRTREELHFRTHGSDIDEPVILWVEFSLERDQPERLMKRMRRAWVARKAREPLSFQACVRMFRDPAVAPAATLVERAGLVKTRQGGAEISDRNGNYVIAHPGTTAKDIIQLMAHAQERIRSVSGVTLERELHIW